MAFYEKKPNQLLIDLINQANPDTGIDLRTLQNTRLGTPKPYPTLRQQEQLRVVKAFTEVGEHIWIPPKGVEYVDLLVVGGGGAGGWDPYAYSANTGGGGAGGLVFIPNYPVKHLNKIVVGAGGSESSDGDGHDSWFGEEVVAKGGGQGGTRTATKAGRSGGSSGGYGYSPADDPEVGKGNGRAIQPRLFGLSGQYGFGNEGGINQLGGAHNPFGGGGAGESAPIDGKRRGAGGHGLCRVTPEIGPYDREYRFADVFGVDHGHVIEGEAWFAGGGGGTSPNLNVYTDGSNGGNGGGGRGTTDDPASETPGMPNTGGGGGGSSYDRDDGEPGGSGIVMVAYNNPRVNQPGFKYQTVNTEIDIFPAHDSPIKGKVTMYYRRIILQDFFKNREVRFDRWTEDNRLTVPQLLELYNQEFGTQFIPEDFEDKTFSPSSNEQRLNVLDTSFTYLGYLEFVWNPNERELDQILETNAIDGYVWDPRFTTEPTDPKPYLTFLGWGFDYGRHYENLIESVPSGAVIDEHTPVLNALVDHCNRVHGTSLDTAIPHTETNGLGGLTVVRYTLPNNTVDEANAFKFNKVYMIRALPDSWFTGTLFFHYDPKEV